MNENIFGIHFFFQVKYVWDTERGSLRSKIILNHSSTGSVRSVAKTEQ